MSFLYGLKVKLPINWAVPVMKEFYPLIRFVVVVVVIGVFFFLSVFRIIVNFPDFSAILESVSIPSPHKIWALQNKRKESTFVCSGATPLESPCSIKYHVEVFYAPSILSAKVTNEDQRFPPPPPSSEKYCTLVHPSDGVLTKAFEDITTNYDDVSVPICVSVANVSFYSEFWKRELYFLL